MIIGTAGHIDHGKTALVRALTGVDTDRLPEERRRGITIELGFAPLSLDGLGTVGIVDVPGHEAFVRTMVAGASGVDVALLVIAADEGVMPQTREHLAILGLLGISRAVVALTKKDLVDADWLALAADDVSTTLETSSLRGARVIPVSAVTGDGLDDLRGELSSLLQHAAASEKPRDLFRLPVDRVFSIRGAGTVVTGTLWSGSIRRDEIARILPVGRESRVRGVESHGSSVAEGRPGARIAVALSGVDTDEIPRGSTLVTDDSWTASRVVRADIELAPEAPALGPRTRVRLHLGTADVGARIIAVGGALQGGDRRPARIVTDEPIVARAGDRFVLRSPSPTATIGGGVITDPLPSHRRARPWPHADASPAERLAWILSDVGSGGVPLRSLPVRLGLDLAACRTLVEVTSNLLLGDDVYSSDSLGELQRRVLATVNSHHERQPLDAGISLGELRSGASAPARAFEEVMDRLEREGRVVVTGSTVKRAGWEPTLSAGEARARDAILAALRDAGSEPPSVSELTALLGSSTPALLRILGADGAVVQVEADRYYEAGALATLVSRLRSGMQGGRQYSPAELRDVLGVSRKYLIPLLEYCDRAGVTDRREGGRVVR